MTRQERRFAWLRIIGGAGSIVLGGIIGFFLGAAVGGVMIGGQFGSILTAPPGLIIGAIGAWCWFGRLFADDQPPISKALLCCLPLLRQQPGDGVGIVVGSVPKVAADAGGTPASLRPLLQQVRPSVESHPGGLRHALSRHRLCFGGGGLAVIPSGSGTLTRLLSWKAQDTANSGRNPVWHQRITAHCSDFS
jgi:hypothetical protein